VDGFVSQLVAVDVVQLTHMNDLYAKAWIKDGKPQETDIHWRCKKGKGSFNWRMKFPVKVPMKFPSVTAACTRCASPLLTNSRNRYLHLQLWDKDIVKWSDCIAEVEMDLTPHLNRALRAKAPINVFAPEVGNPAAFIVGQPRFSPH